MNTKKILGVVAVLALVAVAMVGAVSAATSTDYYVDADNGDDSNAGTSDAPFKTLGAALNASGVTDIYLKTNVTLAGDLTINKSVNIKSIGGTKEIILNGYKIVVAGASDDTLLVDFGRDTGVKVKINTVTPGNSGNEGPTGIHIGNAYSTSSSTLSNTVTVQNLYEYTAAITNTAETNYGKFLYIKANDGTLTVKDSVFDFTAFTQKHNTDTLIGVQLRDYAEGGSQSYSSTHGSVVFNNCSISVGKNENHRSQAVVSSLGNTSLTFETGCVITCGESTSAKTSCCIRITDQNDGAPVELNGVTLNAVGQTGGSKVGIEVDPNKSTIGTGSDLKLTDVTFNVDGYAIWKELESTMEGNFSGYEITTVTVKVSGDVLKIHLNDERTTKDTVNGFVLNVNGSSKIELDSTSFGLVSSVKLSTSGSQLVVQDVAIGVVQDKVAADPTVGSSIAVVSTSSGQGVQKTVGSGGSFGDETAYSETFGGKTEVGYEASIAYTFVIPAKIALSSTAVTGEYSITMTTASVSTGKVYMTLTDSDNFASEKGSVAKNTFKVVNSSNAVKYTITPAGSSDPISALNTVILEADTASTAKQGKVVTFAMVGSAPTAGSYIDTLTFSLSC